MIGNAVPVKLAEYVADSILEYIKHGAAVKNFNYDSKPGQLLFDFA